MLVPVVPPLLLGLRLLCRADNDGTVYLGSNSDVTGDDDPVTGGVLLPGGDPAVSYPFVVPAEHFGMSPGVIYLVGSGADQVVDWSAQ